MTEPVVCPSCGSADVLYSEKRQQFICEDCDHRFVAEQSFVPKRIFLSYGHDKHAALATRLKSDLEGRKHKVWFDLDRLQPGGDWEAYIEQGLNWAAGAGGDGRVVLLMTPHSVRRPRGYCLNEIARALQRLLPVVPIMVVECEPPLSICRIQWLDMQDCVPVEERRERYEAKLERLVEALEQGRIDFEGTQSRLQNVLKPLPFEADIERHLDRFIGREWVFRAIDDWLRNPNPSRVFWLQGDPGVGKTAIAAWLCRNRREIAAFHLCRHGHRQKADPRNVVTSIAYQLSTQLPDHEDRLGALDLEEIVPDSDAGTLLDRLVVQPLSSGFPRPDHPVAILIDGLDEASDGGSNELARFIATEWPSTPDWLRLIVTSRPEPEVTHPLQGLSPYELDASEERNRDDIRRFLRLELVPYGHSTQDTDAAVEVILERSEGVFLYAEWVRAEIAAGRLSLDRLDEFPQGLGEVYAEFFARQFPDARDFALGVRPALEIIAAARAPFTVAELGEMLGWDEYAEDEFLDGVGSLFPADGQGVRPFHRSVMGWLTDRATAGPYFVSVLAGHRRLAEHGWRQYRAGAPALSPYALAHLPHHLIALARWDDLEHLVTDLNFTRTKALRMTVRDLMADMTAGYRSLPSDCAWSLMVEGLAAANHSVYQGTPVAQAESDWAKCTYAELPDDLQELNRASAIGMLAGLASVGYVLEASGVTGQPTQLEPDHSEVLAAAEHNRWVQEKLDQGWRWGQERDAEARTNPYIVPWEELTPQEMLERYGENADRVGPGPMPEATREWDRGLVRAYPYIAQEAGYVLVREQPAIPESTARDPSARGIRLGDAAPGAAEPGGATRPRRSGGAQFGRALDSDGRTADLRSLDLEMSGSSDDEARRELLERLAAAVHVALGGGLAVDSGGMQWASADYDALPEELKEQNRDFVRHIARQLAALGYWLAPAPREQISCALPEQHIEVLAEAEHERWLRLKLEQGYRYGPERDEDMRGNPHMVPWAELPLDEMERRYGADVDRVGRGPMAEDEKRWNRELFTDIPKVFASAGYALVHVRGARS